MSDTVHGDDRQAVGDGMPPLDKLPGLPLGLLLLLGIRADPTDGGRIDQQLCTVQSHEPCCLRVPLVPADQHSQSPDRGSYRLETQIARREIELLVEARIVRNMHLAVLARYASVLLDHDSRVVVKSRSPPLEKREDKHDPEPLGQVTEIFSGRSRDCLRQVAERRVFGLAEVHRIVKFLEHNQFSALGGAFTDVLSQFGDVRLYVCRAALLHHSHFQDAHDDVPLLVAPPPHSAATTLQS